MLDQMGRWVVGAVGSRFVLEPLLLARVRTWWARLCDRKQRLLYVDADIRWDASGCPPTIGFRDHCRAWRRCIFWAWIKEREELKRHAPLWLDF